MLYWVLLSAVCALSEAAKLDGPYLPPPPPNARDAGGRDDDLQLPLEPPYIDPYTPQPGYLVPVHPGRRTVGRRYKPRKDTPLFSWDAIEDEDQIRGFPDSFAKPRSRFLYGSYSYTGPDNVLVTVTYTADRKKPKGRRRYDEDDYDYGRSFGGYGYEADEDEDGYALEGGVVPTPPSLPMEVQKAFAFHRKKYQPDSKRDGKKPEAVGKQPRNEQPTQKPVIHQGYSYPKPTPQ